MGNSAVRRATRAHRDSFAFALTEIHRNMNTEDLERTERRATVVN